MNKNSQENYTPSREIFQPLSVQLSLGLQIEGLPKSKYSQLIAMIVNDMDISFIDGGYTSTFGRPRSPVKLILKTLILARETGLSLRRIESSFNSNPDFQFIANGSSWQAKRSTLSDYMFLLDKYSDEIFESFQKSFFKYCKAYEVETNESTEYLDGSIWKANNNRKKIYKKDNLKKKIDKIEIKLKNEDLSNRDRFLLEELLKKIKNYQKLMGNRNTIGKNDTDCILIKNKEGAFYAGYNAQVAVESKNGFITNFYVNNNAVDNLSFKEFVNEMLKKNKMLDKIGADSGYGIKEIYQYLKKKNIKPYIKPMNYEKDKEKITAKDFIVSADKNTAVCPNNKVLNKVMTKSKKTATNYKVKNFKYECSECSGCQFSKKCLKSDSKNRTIYITEEQAIINEAIELLNTEDGKKIYGMRTHFCETPFAYIKNNLKVREFRRTKLMSVKTEFMLSVMMFNISKLANLINDKIVLENTISRTRRAMNREEEKYINNLLK